MSSRVTIAAFALLLVVAESTPATEPFYERRREAGVVAFSQGDYRSAVRELRIACFGLLDEPAGLAGCLTYLALAEAELGDHDAFDATFARVRELERRHTAYSAAELPAEIREAFESLSADGEATPQESVDPVTARPDRTPVEVAHELLRANPSRDRLERLFADLEPSARERPEDSELQLTLSEIAYRLRRWPQTVAYFERGTARATPRPEQQFYFAVALLETGDPRGAAEALESCLPHLQRTPFVRRMQSRIHESANRDAPNDVPPE